LEQNPTNDPLIKKRNDKRKSNNAYIDMPNIKSLTFLNPRKFTLGIRINLFFGAHGPCNNHFLEISVVPVLHSS